MTGDEREGWSAEMDRRLAEMQSDPDGYLRRIRSRGWRVNPCRCRSVWCWLDWLTCCKLRTVCDAHDRFITG